MREEERSAILAKINFFCDFDFIHRGFWNRISHRLTIKAQAFRN